MHKLLYVSEGQTLLAANECFQKVHSIETTEERERAHMSSQKCTNINQVTDIVDHAQKIYI